MCPYCGLEVHDLTRHALERHGISEVDMLEHMMAAEDRWEARLQDVLAVIDATGYDVTEDDGIHIVRRP